MGLTLQSRLVNDQIRRNKLIYNPTFFVGSLLIALVYVVFFMRELITSHSFQGARSMGTVFNTLSIVFCIISFFIFFYLNSLLMKRRQKNYGLYSVLGLNGGNLVSLNLYETILMAIVMIGLGIVVGIALSYGIFQVLTLLIAPEYIKIKFAIHPSAIVHTATLFGIIFLLIFIYNVFYIKRLTIINMLKAEERGENEPKANILLGLVSLVLLIGAYVVANRPMDAFAAIKIFFPAVLAVIFGTYGIFIALSVVVLKLIKRSKNIYYKPRPFFNVSNLLFRMKANGAGLATISILFTCAFLTFSTTMTLNLGVEKTLENEFPGDVVVSSYLNYEPQRDDRTIEEAILEDLASEWERPLKALDEAGISYKNAGQLVSMGHSFSHSYSDGDDSGKKVSVKDRPEIGQYYFLNVQVFFDTVDRTDEDKIREVFSKVYAMEFEPVPVTEVDAEVNSDSDLDIEVNSDTNARSYKEITGMNTYVNYRSEAEGAILLGMGTLLFIGFYFILFFLITSTLVVYFKQIGEAINDRERMITMQELGLTHKEVKSIIDSQMLIMFFTPLLFAVINVFASYRILWTLLETFTGKELESSLFVKVSGISVLVFALFYVVVFAITSRLYFRIVRREVEA